MFNLSGSEIIVILLLALVVLGPEKLPDAIRRAGRTYAELKKMGNSFQSEMRSVLGEPMQEMRETADLLRQSVDFTEGETTGTKTPRPPKAPKAPADVASANGPSTHDPRDTPNDTAPDHARATAPADTPDAHDRNGGDVPDDGTNRGTADARGITTMPADRPTAAGTEAVTVSPPDDPDEALINRTLSGGQ